MIKVGLTGGIGSGKSMVSGIFSELQVPVFYADDEAKKAYDDVEILEKVKGYFGDEVFENGRISFRKLARLVFYGPEKLAELNNIVHPFLIHSFNQWVHKQNDVPYLIMEAAIIYESSLWTIFDKIINVSAPEELCIERVMKRDGLNRDEIKARMNNQIPDHIKTSKADFVIINDGASLLIPQVLDINYKILNLIKP
ncbi:MAG TPA: dephospho-CoA kinase [Bacteroidales bacterium]|nr:dephospho-CoA kinase [Bacteroidales bacterium]